MNNIDPGTGTFRGHWPPGATPEPNRPRFTRRFAVVSMTENRVLAYFNERDDALDDAAMLRQRSTFRFHTIKVFEEIEP